MVSSHCTQLIVGKILTIQKGFQNGHSVSVEVTGPNTLPYLCCLDAN